MEDNELKQLQNKILEIAIDFDDFCKKNDITYYLMGGSALGAIRHHGFIPWDDDFDVFMNHKNYKKFLKVAADKLDNVKYYLQKEDTKEWPMYFSKIRMNNTTFIEYDVLGKDMHHGIYIDVMCLNNTSKNIVFRYIQYLSARILNARALDQKGYKTSSKIKRLIILMSKLLVNSLIKKILLNIVRCLNKKETALVGHFFGRAPFKKTSFPKIYLNKPRYADFENVRLPVPFEVEKYLEVRYGKNFMQLPTEEEKILYPSHVYIVDTKKDYKSYM